MRYSLTNNRIQITAEPTDAWTGETSSDGLVIDDMIACGRVVAKDGRRLRLRITLNGKPELAALVSELDTIRANTVSIRLASRGWGDYSPVTWTGDIRRPDAEIIAECEAALACASDVDAMPADITALVVAARDKHNAPRSEPKPTKRGPGWCERCESYCYGDCEAH